MNKLNLLLILILFTCTTNEENFDGYNLNGSKGKIQNRDTIKFGNSRNQYRQKSKPDDEIDIKLYKRFVDSIITNITGYKIPSKLNIDSLSSSDVIFVELKKTPLKNLTKKSVEAIKYKFSVPNKIYLAHTLVTISFSTTNQSDSIFNMIKKVAIEKSWVPGLTYKNDYITKVDKKIYWLNSSCGFSYKNHMKFVSSFNEMMNIKNNEAIKCICGKVICKVESGY